MIIASKSCKIEGTTKQGVWISIKTFAQFVDITKTLCNMNLFSKNVVGRSSLDFFASIAVEVEAAIMTGKKWGFEWTIF